jgi:hypothetical protein
MIKSINYNFSVPELSDKIKATILVLADTIVQIDSAIKNTAFKGEEFTAELKTKLESLSNFNATNMNNSINTINQTISSIQENISSLTEKDSSLESNISNILSKLTVAEQSIKDIKTVLDNDKDGSIFDAITDLVTMINNGDADLVTALTNKTNKEEFLNLKKEVESLKKDLNNLQATPVVEDKSTGYKYELTYDRGNIVPVITDKSKVQLAYDSLSINNENVTDNLILPTNSNDCLISWSTSDSSIITNTGVISRPSYQSSAAQAIITATISFNSESITKDFIITVSPLTDSEQIELDKTSLSLGDTSAINSNISLPATIGFSSINWVSSDNKYMKNNGKLVKQPLLPDSNKTITLTATLTLNSETTNKDFVVVIEAREKTDTEKLSEAFSALTLGDVSNITDNINLLSKQGDVTVSWSSSDLSHLTNSGVVSRPIYKEENAIVTLTATLTIGSETTTKDFVINIISLNASEQILVDKNNLTLGDTSKVTSSIILPTTIGLSKVSWTSSDTYYIDNKGSLLERPDPWEDDAQLTLKATLTLDQIVKTKDFSVTVLAKAE